MNEKLVKFVEATSADLTTAPLQDGAFMYTTDTNSLYRDTSSARVLVSGSDVMMHVDEQNEVLNIVTNGSRVSTTIDEENETLVFNMTSLL